MTIDQQKLLRGLTDVSRQLQALHAEARGDVELEHRMRGLGAEVASAISYVISPDVAARAVREVGRG